MIEKMLSDIAFNDFSPEEIKEAVIQVLSPYFDHKESLDKYACDSEVLSIFEFFVRYYYDEEFVLGIKQVLSCYKMVISKYKDLAWRIILSTRESMMDVDNKMYSIRADKVNLKEEDHYEKMMQIFRRMGNTLEISSKSILKELYALLYLYHNGDVDYEKIKKMDFGVIINNILSLNMLNSNLFIDDFHMKLSDWRNIAFHHSYSLLANGFVSCTYGKNNPKCIQMSMQELERNLHQVMRSCNIFSISRSIFIYDSLDFIDDFYEKKMDDNAYFREQYKCEQFRISLLSQEFQLKNIVLEDQKIEIDLLDLYKNGDQKLRIVHCSQLLYSTWTVWRRDFVYINYFDYKKNKICCIFVEGKVCRLIAEGKEKLEYLAEQFQIEFF